jgi:hypothetical protein
MKSPAARIGVASFSEMTAASDHSILTSMLEVAYYSIAISLCWRCDSFNVRFLHYLPIFIRKLHVTGCR